MTDDDAAGPDDGDSGGVDPSLRAKGAWVVSRRRAGRARPAATGAGATVAIDDDVALEREADRLGGRAGSVCLRK